MRSECTLFQGEWTRFEGGEAITNLLYLRGRKLPLCTVDGMKSDMNKSKRQLSPDISIAARKAEIHWQVTSYCAIFKSGSLPPILGKTLTLRTNHGTARPGRGSLMATHSQNGRIRDQVHSYGSAGNVSCFPALTFSQRLMPSVRSWCWEERPLVR